MFFICRALSADPKEIPAEGIHTIWVAMVIMGILNGFGHGIVFLLKQYHGRYAASILSGSMVYLTYYVAMFLALFGQDYEVATFVIMTLTGIGLGALAHFGHNVNQEYQKQQARRNRQSLSPQR